MESNYKYLSHNERKELKKKVLNNGSFEIVKTLKKQIFYDPDKSYTEFLEMANIFCEPKEIQASLNLMKCRQATRKNIHKRILKILLDNKHLKKLFVTLTFSNDCLNRTSEKTRREYVRKFLSLYCDDYIANYDLGKNTEREHYHAIVSTEYLDLKWWHHHCGKIIEIRHININEESSSKRLALYITKLKYHALKESTTSRKIIYARKKKEE